MAPCRWMSPLKLARALEACLEARLSVEGLCVDVCHKLHQRAVLRHFLPIHVRHCAREHRADVRQGWSSSFATGKSPDVPSLRPAHNGGSCDWVASRSIFACKSAFCKQCFGRRSFGNVMTMQIARRLLPSIGVLSAFEATARTGSVTAAARELSLTQSAVSRQIKALEHQLGIELFVRERQTVSLTEAGRTYCGRDQGSAVQDQFRVIERSRQSVGRDAPPRYSSDFRHALARPKAAGIPCRQSGDHH